MATWPSIKMTNFTHGYIDKIDDNQLPEGALRDCRNVISRRIGRITSRNGQQRLNNTVIGYYPVHGLFTFYSKNTKYLLVAVNGSVYYCTPPDGTMTLLKSGFNAEATMLFVTAFIDGENHVMGFNGVDTPWKWNGDENSDAILMNDYRSVSREQAEPNEARTIYTLKHNPVRAGSSKFSAFSNNSYLDYEDYTLDENAGTITFDTARINAVTDKIDPDSQVVVYPLNGRIEALHPFLPGCTVTVYDKDDQQLKTFEDETELGGWKADYASGVITSPLSLDYAGRMPFYVTYEWEDVIKVDYFYSNGLLSSSLRRPVAHKGRIFALGGDEHLYWSDITENGSEYESWPPINNWPINRGSGEEDGCLMILASELYIFLNRSIHRFRGNDLDDFRLEQVVAGVGCAGALAATADKDGDLVYFISDQGLYAFDGVTAKNLSRDVIPGLWSHVSASSLGQSAIKVWDGLVLFSLPFYDSEINNMVIAYDPAVNAFWPWDSMDISMWAEISTTSGTKLYSGKTTEGLVLEQDVGYGDDDENILAYFSIPTLDLGEADMLKKSRYIYVEHGEENIDAWTSVYVSKNYESALEINPVKADGALRKYALRPIITGKWRYLGITLTFDQYGKLDVRSIKIPYKVKEKPSVKGDII